MGIRDAVFRTPDPTTISRSPRCDVIKSEAVGDRRGYREADLGFERLSFTPSIHSFIPMSPYSGVGYGFGCLNPRYIGTTLVWNNR